MQAARKPAAILFRLPVQQLFEVLAHLDKAHQPRTVGSEINRRDIVVQQGPPTCAVRPAGEIDFERGVSGHAATAGPSGTKQGLHLALPLRVRGIAQAEAIGKQAVPVLAAHVVNALAETFAPQIAGSLGAVVVMGIAPEPRCDRPVFVAPDIAAGRAPICLGLRAEQSGKCGARQLTRIPRVVRLRLNVADPAKGDPAADEHQYRYQGRTHGVLRFRDSDSKTSPCPPRDSAPGVPLRPTGAWHSRRLAWRQHALIIMDTSSLHHEALRCRDLPDCRSSLCCFSPDAGKSRLSMPVGRSLPAKPTAASTSQALSTGSPGRPMICRRWRNTSQRV